jgi:hypothetical protein
MAGETGTTVPERDLEPSGPVNPQKAPSRDLAAEILGGTY